ncbi:hypothetical protein P0D88_19625 [Paraburkholderia sp. RL18-103-BIB-C]|uniref:hypothetical protein n=1 Tax=unclassified Paraburkholderia TaxID=2615204 RepID=UPI0038BDBBE1
MVELLDRLDLVLMQMPVLPSVCRALSDLNYRLGAASPKPAARINRPASPRRRRAPVVESLPLFS